MAEYLVSKYPNNEIVLIICNDKGHSIYVPGVYYAKENVWSIPDRFCESKSHEVQIGFGSIGNINEFTLSGVDHK